MKKVCLVILFLFSAMAASAATCFKTEGDFKSKKEKLPKILQEMPLALSAASRANFFGYFAAGIVEFYEGKIRFSLYGTKNITKKPLSMDVGEICADENKAILSFTNGSEPEVIAITGASTIQLRKELPMNKILRDEYPSKLREISQKNNEGPKLDTNAPESGVTK